MRYQVDESLEKVAAAFRRHQIAELIEEGIPSEVWRKMSAEEIMRKLPAKDRKRLRDLLEQEDKATQKRKKKK